MPALSVLSVSSDQAGPADLSRNEGSVVGRLLGGAGEAACVHPALLGGNLSYHTDVSKLENKENTSEPASWLPP